MQIRPKKEGIADMYEHHCVTIDPAKTGNPITGWTHLAARVIY